jgi:hypothetical protein
MMALTRQQNSLTIPESVLKCASKQNFIAVFSNSIMLLYGMDEDPTALSLVTYIFANRSSFFDFSI